MNDERVDLNRPSALEMQHQQLAQLLSLQQEQLTVLQAQTREIVAALRDVQRSSRQSDVAINNVTMSFGDMVSLFVRSGLAAVPAMLSTVQEIQQRTILRLARPRPSTRSYHQQCAVHR